MVMEHVGGGELFEYIIKHGKVSSLAYHATMQHFSYSQLDWSLYVFICLFWCQKRHSAPTNMYHFNTPKKFLLLLRAAVLNHENRLTFGNRETTRIEQ